MRRSSDGDEMVVICGEFIEPEVADVRASRDIITELTRQELEKRINTLIQYEVDAAIIDFLFGRSHEKAILGDTIRVKDPSFDPPLYLDARIIGVKRRPSDPSQKKYTLGDFIEYAEEDIVMKRWELISRLMEVKFEIAKSPEPPENPTHNQLWIDTSDPQKDIYKRWDAFSDTWVEGPGGPPEDLRVLQDIRRSKASIFSTGSTDKTEKALICGSDIVRTRREIR